MTYVKTFLFDFYVKFMPIVYRNRETIESNVELIEFNNTHTLKNCQKL